MINTSLCDALGIKHPILLAPMGNTGNPELVAAVSEAGGLGLMACTWRGFDQTRKDVDEIRRCTDRPFGVNFVLHLTPPGAIEDCLAQGVPVLSIFRGDPADVAKLAKSAGAKVIYQATNLEEVRQAKLAGCDAVIAQGREAGGHMGPLPLWSFLPMAVDACGSTPVVAAGGLVEGRDLAAALSLGATGVVMGTRFLATAECTIPQSYRNALIDAGLGDTVDSGIWDLLWGDAWPGVNVRAIRNALSDRWAGDEEGLKSRLEETRSEFMAAQANGDGTGGLYLAGEGTGRITSIEPAAQVVRRVIQEAEDIIGKLHGRVRTFS